MKTCFRRLLDHCFLQMFSSLY